MSEIDPLPSLEEDVTQLKLKSLYAVREAAFQRLTMAQQTLAGAQAAAMDADARFKGVMEFVYGPNYTFEWRDGKLIVDTQGNAAAAKSNEPNGEVVVMQGPGVPNRAVRRALARKK